MRSERIEVIVDGRATAFGAGEPKLSSSDTPWSGFLVERLAAVGVRKGCSLGHPQTLLVLLLQGAASIGYRRGPEQHGFLAGPESISIWPAGAREDAFEWSGDGELLAVSLPEAHVPFSGRTGLDRQPITVAPHHVGVLDAPLARLVRSMEAEVAGGSSNGPAYGEALSAALAAYLSARYGAHADPADEGPAHHEAAALERVMAHIRENLAGDLSVPALAALADLSPQALCRQFRQTLGMTPHRYVMRERIRRAQTLLRGGRHSVLDVAQGLGFATQSHFTEAFRRLTGTTPRRYRQDA